MDRLWLWPLGVRRAAASWQLALRSAAAGRTLRLRFSLRAAVDKSAGCCSTSPVVPVADGTSARQLVSSKSGTKRTLCASDSQGIPGSSSVGAKSVTDGDATARLPLEPGIDGTNTQVIALATGIVSIDDDKEDDEGHVGGNNQKRHKRCTSWVW
ncbi:hypothetical protein ZEAMMB73_Zm00001d007346, partial [Zea mays]